jgi:large-conductance mechanosensitive channel
MDFGGFLILVFVFLILAIVYIVWESLHWWKQWEKQKKEEHTKQERETDHGPN